MNNRIKKFYWVILGGVLIVLLVVAGYYLAKPKPAEQVTTADAQFIAYQALEAASEKQPEILYKNGFPIAVMAKVPVEGDDPIEQARDYLETYQHLYRQGHPYLELHIKRSSGSEAGSAVQFYQTYRGLRIVGAELVIQINEDMVYGTGGNLLDDVIVDTIPAISLKDAEAAVIEEEGGGGLILGESTLVVFDESLFNYDLPREPHLVWEITARSGGAHRYFVDAQSGAILYSYPLFASHGGALDGVDIDIETANHTNSTQCFGDTTADDHIGSETGLISAYLNDYDAVMAWFTSRETYAFYHTTYEQHSWAPGALIQIYIDVDLTDDDLPSQPHNPEVGNAVWTGESCGAMKYHEGWVAQDVMTHEFTHALIDVTTNLVYSHHSGAVNESFADIMAAVQTKNWTMGESCCGSFVRSMSNPEKDMLSKYKIEPDDNGGVHSNSGIINKAAWLISEGGDHNGWTVEGIGETKVGALSAVVMTSRLTETSGLYTAAAAMITLADEAAANGSWGFTPDDACQVRNAFVAVELWTWGDYECDGISDLYPDSDKDNLKDNEDNCPDIFNPGQEDTDDDGKGDVCDEDADNDGIPNTEDNCPYIKNPTQYDRDWDGIGDQCDDSDFDGVMDWLDNCYLTYNPTQKNMDDDDWGDACDPDIDGDNKIDFINGLQNDNCLYVENYDQENADGDSLGDACDPCPNLSNYGVAQATDGLEQQTQWLYEWLAEYLADEEDDYDHDGDGIPDACMGGPRYGDLTLTGGKIIPDGSWFEAEVRAVPGETLLVPIPACPPEEDDRGYAQDTGALLIIEGLDPDIGVFIVNNFGDLIGSPRPEPGIQYLPYRQSVIERQFIQFRFPKDHAIADDMPISLSIFCGPFSKIDEMLPHKEHAIAPGFEVPPNPDELSHQAAGDQPLVTITPTAEEACIYTAALNIFCRSGPGKNYPEIDTFTPDMTAPITGQSTDGMYWYVVGPHYGAECTIPSDARYGTTSGGCSTIPRFTPMPVPLTAWTETPTIEDKDRQAPTDAPMTVQTPTNTPVLGCWVFNPTFGGNTCVVPCPPAFAPGVACTP